ncbi:CDP-diacylglycerol--glycerol-3-phosphate 3-phosphatidyltransferase, mitochondrial [Astathelohania contejeani]|uniref:CDP-diacylglycerol--glycerol-3-phosphate 3-phosphatidyltransferase n=1 Tax=Astathelohania contejeani TaxID=164912 RepID=A0ABQ7I250_9MICR|nr:CDP-diacylglycerol--glycerol-3-phosphate 3-phosphatidyltransferase, mitochondrial [Thelohania contejeani]
MIELRKKLDKIKFYEIDEVLRISKPNEFYSYLCNKLQTAKIACLICLYIGMDDECIEILKIIQERKLRRQVTTVILDCSRGKSNKLFLEKIRELDIEEIFYYFDLKHFFLMPRTLKELSGVFHSKIFAFDDEAIITGANLDRAYFSDRLDR